MSYFDDDADAGLSVASYERILFPSGQCRDENGHVIVEHGSPGIPGADVEVVRRRAVRGSIEIPLFNTPKLKDRFGKNPIPDLYVELVNAFIATPRGTLFHPALGSFQAAIVSWSRSLDPQKRNGWTLGVQWVEHNAEARNFLNFDVWGDGDPTATMGDDAAAADAQGYALPGWQPMAPQTAASLTTISAPLVSVGQIDDALGALTTLCARNLSLVGAASQSSLVTTLERFLSAADALRRSLLGAGALRRYVVPREMAVWDVALAVYGNSLRASLLSGANAIPDPLAIPSGTVLLCPPEP